MKKSSKIDMQVTPETERPSREELIKTANYYFLGLQQNDGKGYYPFTDDCDRYEKSNRATNVPLKPGEKMPDPLKETVCSAGWSTYNQGMSDRI